MMDTTVPYQNQNIRQIGNLDFASRGACNHVNPSAPSAYLEAAQYNNSCVTRILHKTGLYFNHPFWASGGRHPTLKKKKTNEDSKQEKKKKQWTSHIWNLASINR